MIGLGQLCDVSTLGCPVAMVLFLKYSFLVPYKNVRILRDGWRSSMIFGFLR